MSRDKEVVIGIDSSYEQGLVVVFNHKAVLWTHYLHNKMQHALHIASILNQAYAWAINNQYEIKGLATGLGPGSFVGIRVALATSLGFSFGKSLPLVGVCSHLALASSFTDSSITVVMKASGDLVYVSKYLHNKLLEKIAVQKISTLDLTGLIISDIEEIVNNNKTAILCKGLKDIGFYSAFMKSYYMSNLKDQSVNIKPNYIKEANVYTKTLL